MKVSSPTLALAIGALASIFLSSISVEGRIGGVRTLRVLEDETGVSEDDSDTCPRLDRPNPFPLAECPIPWQPIQAPDGSQNNMFGSAVATSEDWMAVGAPGDSEDRGSVYVYRKASGGSGQFWLFHSKLTPVQGQLGDAFSEVAISGDTIAVGSKLSNYYGEDSGSAYVYRYDPVSDVWRIETKIVPSDGRKKDNFGNSLDLRGDTLLIGANRDDNHNKHNVGAVYYYRRRNSSWRFVQKLTVDDYVDNHNSEENDEFGTKVMLSDDGESAIITAPNRNKYGVCSGVAYVFQYDFDDNEWYFQMVLAPNDGNDYAKFGFNADIDGDTAVISAYKDDDMGLDAGAVYVFKYLGGFWIQKAKLLAADGADNHLFGRSVAVKNGVIAAGAMETYGADDSGAVYIFTGEADNWMQKLKLTSPDKGIHGDDFGQSIAIECPDNVIIGARFNKDQGHKSGNAYSISLCGY